MVLNITGAGGGASVPILTIFISAARHGRSQPKLGTMGIIYVGISTVGMLYLLAPGERGAGQTTLPYTGV
jgi:hypothetical protein